MNLITSIFEKIMMFIPRPWFVNLDEGGVRITCGHRYKLLSPGWYVRWPLIHTFIKINVTTQIKDVRAQSVTTYDGKDLCVGAAIRYKVRDASLAILKVQDYDEAIQATVLGAVTRYIADHSLIECLRDIEGLETELTSSVAKASRGWGLEISKVFITDFGTVKNLRHMIGNGRLGVEALGEGE